MIVMEQLRPLILRSNRYLGSALISAKLVSEEAVEQANQRLIELLQSGSYQQAAIINILIGEQQSLDESAYINYLVENENASLIDLNACAISTFSTVDTDLCRATWTVPFDRIGEPTLVASTCLPSKPVQLEWEKVLDGKVFWFATTLASIHAGFDALTASATAPATEGAQA